MKTFDYYGQELKASDMVKVHPDMAVNPIKYVNGKPSVRSGIPELGYCVLIKDTIFKVTSASGLIVNIIHEKTGLINTRHSDFFIKVDGNKYKDYYPTWF